MQYKLGSSGSSILNLSNYKIIGVHKGGTNYNFNEGIFIKCIIDNFNRFNNDIFENKKEIIKKKEKIF